jgi:hypothetical protein
LTAQGNVLFLFLPKQNRDKRGLPPFMLSSAVRNGSLVEARCVGCSPLRWYHPADLILLYGDVPAIRLMRCGRCRSLLNIKVTSPLTEERQKIRLRRLDRVWWVGSVSWRDEA